MARLYGISNSEGRCFI